MIARLLVLSVIAIGLGLPGCKPKEDKGLSTDVVNNPATAEGQQPDGKAPVFSFVEETHDFGKIQQGEKVSYNFKFTNTGNADLIITDAKATCGCTVPDYPKQPVEPGKEGIITVTFDSAGKAGKVSKTVTLTANTVPNTKVLTITTEIEGGTEQQKIETKQRQ